MRIVACFHCVLVGSAASSAVFVLKGGPCLWSGVAYAKDVAFITVRITVEGALLEMGACGRDCVVEIDIICQQQGGGR